MNDDPLAWRTLVTDAPPWQAPRPLPGRVDTERTTVRLYERGDGPALFETIQAEREGMLPWMVWAITDHRHLEDSVHYVELHRRAARSEDCNNFPMGIFERSTGRMLGATGLHGIDPQLRQAEVGYWVRRSAMGQGLCTEAVAALIGAALGPTTQGGWGLRRIYLHVATTNRGSQRVCEKLGLRLEGRFRQDRFLNYPPDDPVGWTDILQYAVLAHEWDHATQRAKPGIGWPDE